MSDPTPETYFLPAKRAKAPEVRRQAELAAKHPYARFFKDFPVAVLLLNNERQIVYYNDKASELIPGDGADPIGRRPGEAFSCIHCADNPSGCGTGRSCKNCGAAKSLNVTLSGFQGTEECSLVRSNGVRTEYLDLLIWTKPVIMSGERFLSFVASDLSAHKRRDMMERAFQHDVANTATGIASILSLMRECEEPEREEYQALAQSAAEQLVDEVRSHKALAEAEAGALVLDIDRLEIHGLLLSAENLYRYFAKARDIGLELEGEGGFEVETDGVLLKRVLGNLVKNAVEACDAGDSVILSCRRLEGDPRFVVRIDVANPAAIAQAARDHIFQRAFSTKGRGRGFGTYAAKLFVEDYLGGAISFSSDPASGTVFSISLPDRPPDSHAPHPRSPGPAFPD